MTRPTFTILLPLELRNKLQKLADQEKKSLGKQIIYILTQYMKVSEKYEQILNEKNDTKP